MSKSITTITNTGYKAEWWLQEPGQPTRFYTRTYIAGVKRRMKHRGVLTDEPIGPGAPTTLTVIKPHGATGVIRQCESCSQDFEVVDYARASTVCFGCRSRKAAAAKRKVTA